MAPSMSSRVPLTKTRFLSGCQCSLKLWYDIHRRDLAPPPDAAQQALFRQGREVGALARERWPGGVMVHNVPGRPDAALERTRDLMGDGAVPAVYEAAITHGGALTRVDVLARAPGGGWDLVEVKSGTRAREHFELDVAVQYWILVGAGLDVRRAGLLLLDREYVYPGGAPDLQDLFRFEDLTEACEERLEEIGDRIDELHGVMDLPRAPDIPVGEHCFTPYECRYYRHCSRDVVFPDHPIDILPHLKAWRREGLENQGIEDVTDIPEDYPLTETQERVRRCIVTGEPWRSDKLRTVLEDVAWPLYALDFEAAQFAVPRYVGTRPFDAIPFQFSCHIQREPGAALDHREFLAETGDDPRDAIARSLLDALGEAGSILVYSGYESRIIGELAGWLPHLAEGLQSLRPRLVDLLKLLERHYCHPDFRGSYSIKNVLPVLVPGMSYGGMDISDGRAAGRAWLELIETQDWVKKQALVQNLLDYCRQDSLAMLKLRDALLAEDGGGPA